MDKGKAHIIENFHALGSLESMLASDDQQTFEPLDEVVDI
jgi:hypothetical protein